MRVHECVYVHSGFCRESGIENSLEEERDYYLDVGVVMTITSLAFPCPLIVTSWMLSNVSYIKYDWI